MEKTLRDKKIVLILTFCLLFFAAAFTVSSFMTYSAAMYVLMLIFSALSAVCCYLLVFCVFFYFDITAAVRLLNAIGSSDPDGEIKEVELSEISKIMGWNEKSVKRFIKKRRIKGYLEGINIIG